MLAGAFAQLDAAGILPGSQYHEQGAAVIAKLLEKGALSQNEYIALTRRKVGDKLLEANVFAFHFTSQLVTFQSTLVRRVCEETSAWKVRNERSVRRNTSRLHRCFTTAGSRLGARWK